MKVFRGALVHATHIQPLNVVEDGLLGLQNGKIVFVEEASKLSQVQEKYDFQKDCIIHLGKDEFLMPGFVDTHVHASQYPQTGTRLDLLLLDWLQNYTFPLEARYQDNNFAKCAYDKAVSRFLRNGTTTACYFATNHVEATLQLCDSTEQHGQRAYVGKVNADQNSPDFYIEDTKQSLDDTKKFIEAVLDRKNPLLTPVITPRFAVSCTTQLLQGLGDLARQYNLPVQSHISENKAECTTVQQLYPQYPTYAGVYEAHGLLTNKTVMAHGIYLSEEELQLFASKGTGISHCPNSNLSIRSGLLDVRNAMKHGVKVGIGTDVSGGYAPSMLDAIRLTIQVSNVLSMEKLADYKVVDFREAFRLATLGGAQVLGLDDTIGNFESGKDFDALRINVSDPHSTIDVFEWDTVADKVQKFIHLGDDRNIKEVYVAGKKVVQQ